MSSQMITQVTDNRVASAPYGQGDGVTPARVLRGEWIKLISLRSTYVTVALTAIAIIGFGMLTSYSASNVSGGFRLRANVPLEGIMFAQLVIGVLAVVTVTSEYHSGLIRATLAAVPTRRPVFWAKAALLVAVAFVTGVVAGAIAFLAAMAIMPHDVSLSFGQPGAVTDLLGAGLYLAVIALLAAGIGFIIRSTAGSLATVFAIMLVLPIIGQLLHSHWGQTLASYLPTNAGSRVMDLDMTELTLGHWTGFAVFAGYAAVALLLGFVLLRRRDA